MIVQVKVVKLLQSLLQFMFHITDKVRIDHSMGPVLGLVHGVNKDNFVVISQTFNSVRINFWIFIRNLIFWFPRKLSF